MPTGRCRNGDAERWWRNATNLTGDARRTDTHAEQQLCFKLSRVGDAEYARDATAPQQDHGA